MSGWREVAEVVAACAVGLLLCVVAAYTLGVVVGALFGGITLAR